MTDTDYVLTHAGVKVPAIVYGTAWKGEATAQWVQLALSRGFRGIDTACQPKHYHQPGVGKGISAGVNGLRREDLYVQTKFTSLSGQDPARIPYDAKAPLAQQIEQSFAASQTELHTDYIDALILHSPMPSAAQTLEAWRTMETLVDGGGVRQLGISNCYELSTLRTLYEAARIKPAIVQNRFYADSGYDIALRRFCRERGVIYQSFWTLTANPKLLAHKTVKSLAEHYRRTPAQVLFRYLTQEGVVPLTGTRNAAHMDEDLAIFGFALEVDERARIDALLVA